MHHHVLPGARIRVLRRTREAGDIQIVGLYGIVRHVEHDIAHVVVALPDGASFFLTLPADALEVQP